MTYAVTVYFKNLSYKEFLVEEGTSIEEIRNHLIVNGPIRFISFRDAFVPTQLDTDIAVQEGRYITN